VKFQKTESGDFDVKKVHHRGSYVLPAFERATVADFMCPGVMSCAPDASLATVAQTMATHHVHAVVVAGVTTDDSCGDHLIWGLVSDMDIVRAAEAGIEGHTASDAARSEIVIATVILAGYNVLLAVVPVPGVGHPAIAPPDSTMAAWLDRRVLDGHLWAVTRTWDPEGLLPTVPVFGSTLDSRSPSPSCPGASRGHQVPAGKV